MPIYEYRGQQYDIATDDPTAAKAKILKHLGAQEAPAPAPAQRSALAPAPEPTQPLLSGEFDAGLPTTGTGTKPTPVVGKEPGPAKRAPYRSRVEMLDDAVNLLEEGVDREEMKQSLQKMGVKFEDVVKHGQKRGSSYFKQQAIAPAPSVAPTARKSTDEIKATPETEFLDSPVQYSAEAVGSMFKRVDASLGDVATSYLLQSGAVDAEGAGRLLARNAKQRAANAPSASIRAGMQEIGNAETYGDAIAALATNPRATFTLLAESVLTSLPGMVPALVLGPAGVVTRSVAGGSTSGGMEYGSAMADVLQEKRVNMLDPNAVAKALADPKIMAEIKDKGAKRGLIVGVFDGLSMGLAGRFLKPAQALIAEGKLAGSAATKATMAAWGKELTTQMAGGAGGEFAAQKATGDDKPADVLLEALAEGATAPLEARANLRESRLAEQQAAINKELAAPPPPGRIEPTLDETALAKPAETTAKEPSAAAETTAVIAQKQRADQIAKLTQVLELQGIPTDNAERIATRKVDSELKAEAKTAAIKIPEGRVEEITQELLASGVPPQQAKIDAQALAQEEAQADELAQTEAGGTPNVARPISEPTGASTALAEQPSAEPTAAGVGDDQRDGVVPAGPATTDTAVGEGAQPTALTEVPTAETKSVEETEAERIKAEDDSNAAYEAKKAKAESIAKSNASTAFDQAGEYANLDEALDSYRTNMADTLAEEGLRDDPNYDSLLAAADRAFEAEVTKQRGTTTDGTATTETVQTETQKQEVPAAGAVTKGKRGRPPSPHVVVENAKGGFDHVLNGEVLGSYANQKQATAAANLAKAQDKGDAALIAKNQAKLDAALASKGRGRPEKAPTEDGAPALDNEAKSEVAELESALETYNSPAEQESILNAAMYIDAVANDTSLPKAVRERAQQMLDEDVDPKDVARGKTLRSSDAKVGKADTGFSKLTNGSQAIAHIIKTGNFFQRFVAQRIRNFLVGVKFVVLERGDSIPAEMDGARGLFVYTPGTKERTVYVRGASFGDQQGINIITVLHELLHAATASRIEAGLLKGFKNASLQKFMREMESLMKRAQEAYEEAEVFGDLSPEMQELVANTTDVDKKTGRPVIAVFTDPHEFLAYGMSNPDFQRFLMGVQGKRNEPTGFAKFVADIRDLFGIGAKDATAFTDLVDITDKMLGTRLTPVKTKRTALQQKGKFTPPDFDEQADLRAKRSATTLERDALKAKQKVAESREGDMAEAVKAMQNARDPSKVRDILARAWSGMSYLQREAAVRLPTFDFLSKWAAENGISSLRQTNMYLERMLGMSQQFLVGSEQMIGMLNRGFKEDKNLSRKQFENFVYATTIAEMDPSDPNAVERSKTLDADYKALGPVGQRMYKDLRNYYEGIIELYSDLLDDQIQNARGLSQEDKNNLMATLRKTFEAKARIRPYFPLVRRGDFWLAIGSGDRRRFYTFESRGDRNAKAKELAEGRGDDIEDMLFRQEFVQGNNLGELRMASKDSSQMLKQTFDAIDRMDMGDDTLGVGSAREGLKDAVYQIYLNTMPEQTFRKQFTHRKNVIGFSTDIQQNIATTASKQAIQLSRLKYAPLLRNSLSAARDAIREREELSPFVQEAEKRINLALSGQSGGLGEAVAGIANKASFFWFLSGASSALIQPSSVFISGLPVLAGNYNDAAGAAKELGKMTLLVNQYSVFRTNADGTTSLSAPSIANSKSLPADERKAISEMVSRGVSESTYASMVWGYSRTPTESTYFSLDKGWANIPVAVGKGKKLANLLVGALMHNTERLSREAVYLAAYRLGKKQGLSYEDAVQKAVESTNEALGNYDVTNKPRFMQQGVGKVAFQFKTYPLQMTLLLLTNFKKMFPFLNKEGKKEAATKFFGMMGTSYLLAGAANTALFSPIIGLIGWAWSKMSAEEDWPEELKDISFETWFLKVFLPEKLGDVKIGGVPVSDIIERGPLNAITGYDIASRVGLNDLWGRDSKETKTSRESATAFILDNFGGPTASLLLGFADAWDAYALGDYQKMQEKLAPAAIRNLLIANKYADEGMKTGRGKELVNKDDVKTGELIGQAVGFRPDILAATQGPAFKFSGIEQKINNQRNLLLNKLDFELRKDTDEGDRRYNKILKDEVSKFNTKHPSYELTDDAIDTSLLKKAEQRGDTRAGVLLTEKNIPIVEEATNYLERRLDERAKEMRERREKEKNPR
jgi:hypothetical protein